MIYLYIDYSSSYVSTKEKKKVKT